MPRTVWQTLDAMGDEAEQFLMNPHHAQPRCWNCHHLTHSERAEPTDTGRGFYYDSEFHCAFCKADQNEKLTLELYRRDSHGNQVNAHR
jgi:hypothetical protein